MTPAQAGKYVGIPFEHMGRSRQGCDCYGLVALYLKEQFGKDIPDYCYEPDIDTDEMAMSDLFEQGKEDESWTQVVQPRYGDLILLKPAGALIHCGVVLDSAHMLHTMEKTGACIERFDGAHWQGRVLGYWRYA